MHPMPPRCLSALHIFTETIKLAILESPPLHMTQHTELQLSCAWHDKTLALGEVLDCCILSEFDDCTGGRELYY